MIKPFANFIQVELIKNSSPIFKYFEDNNIYFYYYQKSAEYYLFFYGQSDIYLSDLPITIIKELNKRQRKIRSIRGFLLYALDLRKNDKEITVLKTNFQPFFWEKIKDIINQNRSKELLLSYLFPTSFSNSSINNEYEAYLDERLDKLEKERSLLEEHLRILDMKVLELEKKVATKDAGNKKKDAVANDLPKKFAKVLGDLPEMEQKQIILNGFDLNRQGLISIRDYYEGEKNANSRLNTKGYSLKYETVRRSELYKQLNKRS